MNMFSLRTVIDDILLLVRNNNISESEDLSRAQIASWVLAYKAAITKARKDAEDKNDDEGSDDGSLTDMLKKIGPLPLEWDPTCKTSMYRKRTAKPIPSILNKDRRYIFCVHDDWDMPIQYMSDERKYFHRFRKYTGGETTYQYEIDENGDEWITLHGKNVCYLEQIYVEAIFEDKDDETDDVDEDSIDIPGWMIPDIKANIIKNELSFMLARISDDDNNSTLDGIKPQTTSQIGIQK